jgi:Undecaprenyl-phosphate galactose phosphotransferase WbaP
MNTFDSMKKTACLLALLMADIATLGIAFIFAYFLRSEVLPQLFRFASPPLPLATQFRFGFPIASIVLVATFAYEKLYTKRFSFWEETRLLLQGIFLSFTLMTLIIFASRSYQQFSRIVIILAGVFSLGFFPFSRLNVKRLLAALGLWNKRILIIGTNGIARFAAEQIQENDILGYQIQGFLTKGDTAPGTKIVKDLKVLGNIGELEGLSRALGIKDVIIALPSIGKRQWVELVEKCEKITETVRVVPEIGSIFTVGVAIENLGDVLSLSVARNLAKPWNIVIKRSFELVLAVFLTLLLFPFFLITVLAIKIDSRGPVFFNQERLASKNRTFKMHKFRSMHVDGDEKLADYLDCHPDVQLEWQEYRKIKNGDPRVTRVGRILRKFSIDEIPQLINVLKGDMSLIGPRPYLPQEKNSMGETFDFISRVKPGMTGFWQVRGRNILSFRERLLLDEYYIRNWSLWLDIVILLKTLKVLIKREGAY